MDDEKTKVLYEILKFHRYEESKATGVFAKLRRNLSSTSWMPQYLRHMLSSTVWMPRHLVVQYIIENIFGNRYSGDTAKNNAEHLIDDLKESGNIKVRASDRSIKLSFQGREAAVSGRQMTIYEMKALFNAKLALGISIVALVVSIIARLCK